MLLLVNIDWCRQRLRYRPYNLWLKLPRRLHVVVLLLFLLVSLGGLLNRFRGGWLSDTVHAGILTGSLGDVIARVSLSTGTLLLLIVLTGNGWLGLIFFFFMWWAEMLGWGCYFNMAHGPVVLQHDSHADCAGLDRNGMYDWLLGPQPAGRLQP